MEQKPTSIFKTQSDIVEQRYCPVSKSSAYLSSNVKVRDNGMHAVVHVGLAKTGTTTIQRLSIDLKESLKLDGFEMPWSVKIREEEYWQLGDGPLPQMKIFAHCFHPVKEKFQLNEATYTVKKVQYECESDILHYGSDIAARNQSIFLSSENFAHINETGIEELSEYLSQWSKQTIIVFYRRYYDWITSLYRQHTKTRALKDTRKWERSILDFASRVIKQVPKNYISELQSRLEKKFDNIIVMNFHDLSKAGPHETLFCDKTLNMTHACEEIQNEDDVPHENKGVTNLDYFDLVYGAMKAGLIKIDSDKKMHQVATKVQDYHQSMLNNTALKRVCPPQADLDMLLNVSLTFELKYFPGQVDSLESDFKKQATTKLCKVDVDQTLKKKEWGDFFRSITNSSNNISSNIACKWSPGQNDKCITLISKRIEPSLQRRWLFFGDSTVFRLFNSSSLPEVLVHSPLEKINQQCYHYSQLECHQKKGERCKLNDLFGFHYRDHWVPHNESGLNFIGPRNYGASNPYCTDCSECFSDFLQYTLKGNASSYGSCDRSKNGLVYGGYIHMEYARDIEIQTPEFLTTQENLAAYISRVWNTPNLIQEWRRPVCVVSAGLHDATIKDISTPDYAKNIKFMLDKFTPVC